MCDGVINATARYEPLRMVGEGMEHTVLMAGAEMRAVLELEAPKFPGGPSGGLTHNQTGMHVVSIWRVETSPLFPLQLFPRATQK